MGAGHALEDRGADFVHERDVLLPRGDQLGNLGGGARVFATGFWDAVGTTPPRGSRAAHARAAADQDRQHEIGTGNRKKLAVLTACFASLRPCTFAKWEALALSVQFDGLVLVVTPIPKKYMLIL